MKVKKINVTVGTSALLHVAALESKEPNAAAIHFPENSHTGASVLLTCPPLLSEVTQQQQQQTVKVDVY